MSGISLSALERFASAIADRSKLGDRIRDALIEMGSEDPNAAIAHAIQLKLLPKDSICALWAEILGIAYVNPLFTPISLRPEETFPVEIAEKARVLAIYEMAGTVTVAMSDPRDAKLVASLHKILGRPVSPVYAYPDDIEQAQKIFYKTATAFERALRISIDHLALQTVEAGHLPTEEELAKISERPSVSESFDGILLSALSQNASDIHIEPGAHSSVLRFRMDGKLQVIREFPVSLHRAFIIRLKVLAGMDVIQSRTPQDGRFSLPFGAYEQNFRVSILPGINGEKAVIRALGSAGHKVVTPLVDLALPRTVLESVQRVVSSPNGMFIVTGPTGSGKTTTLYSSLSYINKPDINISTIEDPVEYQLPGANHFAVKSGQGLSFAQIMRGLLRQDPDVILLGEIRDAETAKIATEAALTGHFVFTTLHTNNAIQAITRLIEIGVDAYLVAPSVMGVLGQRLLRKTCPHCSETYRPSDGELAKFFSDFEGVSGRFTRGKGCALCRETGYLGRIGVFEHVEVTEEMRVQIAEKAPLRELVATAAKTGFRSMRYDGLMKAALGLTTLDEVERMTMPEFHP